MSRMDAARYGFIKFLRPPDAEDDHRALAKPAGKSAAATDKREGKVKAAAAAAEDVPVLSESKEFIAIEQEQDIPGLAREMVLRWFPRNPSGILSLVSGTDQFHTWKRDDFRSALQAGIVKVLSSVDLIIIDDGLNYGLTKLMGSAVKADETYNTFLHKAVHAGPRKPPTYYVGVLPLERVAAREKFRTLRPNVENEVELVPQKAGLVTKDFDVNRHHSHYIVVDKSYADTGFLRVDLEKQLQNELGMRDAIAESNSDFSEKAATATFVPHIVLFFQGEFEEIDRIRAYVRLRTPVIIMDGCGGMADVLALAVKNGSEPDDNRLRGIIAARIARSFPAAADNKEIMVDSVEKILEIVRSGENPGENNLCYIVDCSRPDAFGALDVPFLQAVITASSEQNANPAQLVRNMTLCLSCNKPDIAASFLINQPPWSQLHPTPPYTAFFTALILPGRESFVDLFMQQRFPVRFFTSHVDLLLLYRKAVGKDFFTTLIWDDILGHNQEDSIRDEFILVEMNPLIESLTGIKNFLDFFELSRVALTPDDDPALAANYDGKGIAALVVYGCLMNRPKLIKVLLKYSMDPIPLTIFVQSMFRGIYRTINNLDTRMGLKRQADEFGGIATDIMDMGIKEQPERAKVFFQRVLPDFNNKTSLQLAFDARDKRFIAHNLVQSWLDQFAHGFVRVKGGWHDMKMVLSALFIFPMYIWLGFPQLTYKSKQGAIAPSDITQSYEPRSPAEADDILSNLRNKQHGTTTGLRYKEVYPPLGKMIYAVWSAPIVKFWVWFLTYILFLILLGTDMMLPACMYLGVDIAVFVCTALMWLELLTRTINDFVWRRRIDYWLRLVELIYQTVFNVLFFLYRIAPYRWDHPFAGRVILAFGVIYYFYRVWNIFYVYDRELGPLTRVVMIMFKQDMPKWIIMMLPFFVSTAVVWQAVITPDYPFTGEDWRRAFFRGVFTVFAAFYSELEYNDQGCGRSTINYDNFTQPASAYPQDRCWLGDYSDHTCNTVSFWAYVFVIQYYFLLKLGMLIILTVFYIFRQAQEMPKANVVWRYYRFNTTFDYYWRSSLPFPFNILGNIYLIYTRFTTKDPSAGTVGDIEMVASHTDTFIFWKGIAAQYFGQKDREEAAKGMPQKQSALLGAVAAQVQGLVGRFSELDKKLMDIDESARDNKLRLKSATSAFLPTSVFDIPKIACPIPHFRCRESPYIGTNIKRARVPDNKVNWTVPLDFYNPEVYSRPIEEFTPEEREFVDAELETRLPDSRLSVAAGSNRSYEWNSVEYQGDDVIYRKSWFTDHEGRQVPYRIDNYGAPINPIGRTGLRGRGSLCRFGPNHKITLAITSTLQGKMRFIAQSGMAGALSLPNVPICHYDNEYSVAAVLIEAILAEDTLNDESDFDPATCAREGHLREFISTLALKQLQRLPDAPPRLPENSVRIIEIYRGYQDTVLNTDNAWLETLILHIEVPFFPLHANSIHSWRSGAIDVGMPDLDAAVVRYIFAV